MFSIRETRIDYVFPTELKNSESGGKTTCISYNMWIMMNALRAYMQDGHKPILSEKVKLIMNTDWHTYWKEYP